MLYKTISPMGAGSLCAVFFLLLQLSLSGQVQYVPPQFENGDIISLDFSLNPGTVGPVLVLTHAYSQEEFSIDSNSSISLDLTHSPFGNGTSLSSSYSIDHVNQLITITLERLDGTSVWVEGWIVQMKGVGVLIDDIQSRLQPEPATLDFQLFPNPARQFVHLELAEESAAYIQLMNSSGQTVRTLHWEPFSASTVKFPLNGLPTGQYVIQVVQNEQLVTHQLLIQ